MTGRQDDNFLPVYRLMSAGLEVEPIAAACTRNSTNNRERVEMVKLNGVNHLAMATGDMDKTILFWRDLLGMRLVAGLDQPGYRHYFFQISNSDLIAFFE